MNELQTSVMLIIIFALIAGIAFCIIEITFLKKEAKSDRMHNQAMRERLLEIIEEIIKSM